MPHRPRLRHLIATLLLLGGLALGGDVVATLLWQEPVSALVATVRRAGLDTRTEHTLSLGPAGQAELASLETTQARIRFLAGWERHTVADGAPLGRLRIPRIGLDTAMIEGTSGSDLELGPGHYHGTALPGEGGVVAVAGHRTTWLAPFRSIDALRPGDSITVLMPYGTFFYAVQRTAIVAPNDWSILRPAGGERLVLSSCQPLFSAARRIVVFARLSGVTPHDTALRRPTGPLRRRAS